MIWRLTYCNGSGDTARLDIQQGGATPIMEIEGTGNPFALSFNGDKKDKTLNFLTSSADIQIYETEDFNIDRLKTSDETELSVKYYINDTLYWSGFVIPDFFSKEIKENSIVSMVASDRIGTLKGVTLTDLPSKITNRELVSLCLAKTGLSLPLKTMADFSNGTNNNDFFRAEILTQRLTDTKGRGISCYDILQSILNQSNSVLVQRKGEWYIVNKMQLEVGSGKLYSTETTQNTYVEQIVNFASVEVGAMRTIEPVGASIGVYHEHGGGRLHPDNYDFAQGGSGWVSKNGFSYTISNQKPVSYSVAAPNHTVTFGESDRNRMMIMGIVNPFWRPDTAPYVENKFPVITSNEESVKIDIDISVLGWGFWGSGSTGRFIILAENDDSRLAFNPNSGLFEEFDNEATSSNSSEPPYVIKLKPSANMVGDTYPVTNKSIKYETVLEKANLSDYTISIRIYGTSGFSGPTAPLFIDFANIGFSNTEEAPRGTLFKTVQGNNFTKEHEIRTVLWGDYINSGLNGYFYNYPIDDTSSLYNGAELTSLWTTPFDTDMLPLLQHVSRQRSSLFSIAHDLINITTRVNVFDPLAILKDCNGNRYVAVSAEFDFLRSKVYMTAEQSLFDKNILKRDFIYSYFGEGEDSIKSIGGIAGGTGGSGGINTGIIGGINEKIDEVEERVNNSRVGVTNLLINTGFLGDFQPLNVDYLTALENNSPIDTNTLKFWTHSNTSVIDAPSRSGKGVRIGSIQQNVKFKAGEPYVLSFWARGTSLTIELVDAIEIPLTSEYERYSFDIVASETKEYTFSLIDSGNTAEVYEIMLSNGNAKVSYSYAEEDDVKAISQIQAINTIMSAIKTGKTETLGGLILSTMIQLGKYKDDVMEKVTSGINGIYNNDNDPAIWAGGSFDDAIRTVQKFIDNPNYEPSEAEWAEMANIVFTHGGDGFFRGYIYALGGMFRGRVIAGSGDSEIILDPESSSVKYMRNGKLVGETFFTASGWVRTQYYEFWTSGELKGIVSMDSYSGFSMQTFLEDGITTDTMTSHFTDGRISNPNLLDLTDSQADEILADGEWYRTGRIVKVKM